MKLKKIKCLWCSKMVSITKKGKLEQHHNLPSRIHCIGSGQPIAHVIAQTKQLKEIRDANGGRYP